MERFIKLSAIATIAVWFTIYIVSHVMIFMARLNLTGK